MYISGLHIAPTKILQIHKVQNTTSSCILKMSLNRCYYMYYTKFLSNTWSCSYRSCANILAPSCSLLTGGGKLADKTIKPNMHKWTTRVKWRSSTERKLVREHTAFHAFWERQVREKTGNELHRLHNNENIVSFYSFSSQRQCEKDALDIQKLQ